MNRISKIAIGLVLVGTGGPAFSQSALPPEQSLLNFDRSISVRQRRIPGYEASNIQLGAFKLQPVLEFSSRYDDNVYSTSIDRRSDVSFQLAPAAALSLDGTRASLNIGAGGEFRRFAKLTTENQNNARANLLAGHDLGDSARINVGAEFRQSTIDRSAQESIAQTVRPFRYRTYAAGIGASQRFARFLISGQAELTRFEFLNSALANGVVIDQGFNNRDKKHFEIRGELKQSESLAYFVETSYDLTAYDERSSLGRERKSKVLRVLGGTKFELPVLARGQIAVGYTRSSYNGTTSKGFSGLAVSSQVTFFPTQLTNVTLSAGRRLLDAGIPQSTGYVELGGGVRVDHELLRSVILTGQVQYQRDTFNDIDRQDRRVNFSLGADYKMNRNITVGLDFEREDFLSKGADRNLSRVTPSFAQDRVDLTLSLRI